MPPLALLAGGLATRLRPHSEKVPKALLSVAGTPFIAHQLKLLGREGIRCVILCISYLGEEIVKFVGDGSRFGLDVRYSRDGDRLLGTGGALRNALPLLGDEFLVMYGDSYLDVPFAPIVDAFRKSDCLGLMTVYRNEGRFDTSNVIFEGDKILVYDKKHRDRAMNYIDYGLGALQARAFSGWPEGPFDLAEVYGALVEASQLAGFEVNERFYEIGSFAGLKETEEYLRRKAS